MNLLARNKVHVALIVAVGLMIYSRTLHAPFVLDDYGSIVNNPLITNFSYFYHPASGKSFFGYGGFLSRNVGYLTFALNYRLGGLDPIGYHLVNIAIHLTAGLLIYRLVNLTFRTPCFSQTGPEEVSRRRAGFIALFAALLFVAHPIQTQAVTYLVQRLASLATLFYLASLTCYTEARLAWPGRGGKGKAAAWFAASLAAAGLALKTKEISYTLPIALFLYEVLFFTGNVRKKLVAAAVSGGLLLSGAALFLAASGKSTGAIVASLDQATRLQTDMSRWDYLATQCRVIVTYLRLVIFPVGQRLDYDYPVYDSFLYPGVLLSALLLAALLGAACLCLYRSRGGAAHGASPLLRLVAFGIFWFFLALSVESSLIPIVDVIFEHRMYLPSAGLFMALSAAISLAGGEGRALPGWPGKRLLAGAAGALLLLCMLTVARNEVWRSEVRLWEDNTWKSPKKARVFLNLGSAAERAGDWDRAESAYLLASGIAWQPFSRLNLGRLYLQLNRLDEAMAQFREALRIDPGLGEAHNNIGKIQEMKLRYEDALKEYLKAVQVKPYLAAPYLNIGALYARQKRYPEALQEYEKAIVRDPEYEEAYLGRGAVLVATGRGEEAAADFRRALQINPSSTEAKRQLRLADVGGGSLRKKQVDKKSLRM